MLANTNGILSENFIQHQQQHGRPTTTKPTTYDSQKRNLNTACHFCDHAAKRPGRKAVAMMVACGGVKCRKVFCSRPACIKKLPPEANVTCVDDFAIWKQLLEEGRMVFICPHCTDESSCPGPQCRKRWEKKQKNKKYDKKRKKTGCVGRGNPNLYRNVKISPANGRAYQVIKFPESDEKDAATTMSKLSDSLHSHNPGALVMTNLGPKFIGVSPNHFQSNVGSFSGDLETRKRKGPPNVTEGLRQMHQNSANSTSSAGSSSSHKRIKKEHQGAHYKSSNEHHSILTNLSNLDIPTPVGAPSLTSFIPLGHHPQQFMMIKPPMGAAPHSTLSPSQASLDVATASLTASLQQASASLQCLRGALQGANPASVAPPTPAHLLPSTPHYVIPTLSNSLPNSSSVIQFSKWPSHLPQFPMTHAMPFINPHPPPRIPNPDENISAPKHIPSPPLSAENSPVNVSDKKVPSPPSRNEVHSGGKVSNSRKKRVFNFDGFSGSRDYMNGVNKSMSGGKYRPSMSSSPPTSPSLKRKSPDDFSPRSNGTSSPSSKPKIPTISNNKGHHNNEKQHNGDSARSNRPESIHIRKGNSGQRIQMTCHNCKHLNTFDVPDTMSSRALQCDKCRELCGNFSPRI